MKEQPETIWANSALSGESEPAKNDSPRRRGMDMMMGFELPVRISLARTSAPLKDVLRLATGSVLELNRSIDDLADVVVNGRVIAQGEIVVVEGNYGIRIRRVNDQARDAASQREFGA